MRGQLWYQERKALFEVVKQTRPQIMFEVGTWEGGGSTFFIAEALYRNGSGILHTTEIDRSRFKQAVKSYEQHLPHLLPHVRFHLGASTDVYKDILSEVGTVDAVLLDGEQDASKTVQEFEMFEPFMRPGAKLLMHDWGNEKMRLLRDRLASSDDWTPDLVVSPRGAVGFGVFSRSGA